MLSEYDKISVAGEFYTRDEGYQANGRSGKWRDGYRIKGYIRTDQLPARVQYNTASAELDGSSYRLRGELLIKTGSVVFVPDGEAEGIRIFDNELPPGGLPFMEIDTYNRVVYQGVYKPDLKDE